MIDMTRGRRKKNADMLNASEQNPEQKYTMLSTSDENTITLIASSDTELAKGRNIIRTDCVIPDGKYGIISDLDDNLYNGFLTENDIRLQHTFVIPHLVTTHDVYAVLFVDDDLVVTERTGNGMRVRNIRLQKGMPIAKIKIID